MVLTVILNNEGVSDVHKVLGYFRILQKRYLNILKDKLFITIMISKFIPFYRLQLLVEKFVHGYFELTNQNLIKVPKVFKHYIIRYSIYKTFGSS